MCQLILPEQCMSQICWTWNVFSMQVLCCTRQDLASATRGREPYTGTRSGRNSCVRGCRQRVMSRKAQAGKLMLPESSCCWKAHAQPFQAGQVSWCGRSSLSGMQHLKLASRSPLILRGSMLARRHMQEKQLKSTYHNASGEM